MEIILAIVVASAVIFFGALISMGNERQRRAIDDLREQVFRWAVQDLRIKREKLSLDVRVDDPIQWLNKIVAKTIGDDLNLNVTEVFDDPQILICTAMDNRKILFTTLSPTEIQGKKHDKRAKLSLYINRNPLLYLPKNIVTYQLSTLNSGLLFDLELNLAWNRLIGREVKDLESLWMYMF